MQNNVPATDHSKRLSFWLSFAMVTATLLWGVAMLASLKWRFLDSLAAGAYHGNLGVDFFQSPRGYLNLLADNNIYLTEISNYGPYTTTFRYHPFVAIVVGCWTTLFSPWTAYGLFVAASVALLALGGYFLASAFKTPVQKAFVYFALFCTVPTYLMLWNAQMHVFLVFAVALIAAGLMRLADDPDRSQRYLRWIQAGILIALLSKPVVMLMLPLFLLLPETRRKIPAPAIIYAVVSLAFLLVPRLNPGGYNATHWASIFDVSSSPVQVCCLPMPTIVNYQDSFEIYSLPRLLLTDDYNWRLMEFIVKIPLLIILAMSCTPLLFSDRVRRIRAAMITVALCLLSHYLCYFLAWEYHYTTLLPLLPMLAWLRQSEDRPAMRRLLTTSFVVMLAVFLPTANVFFAKHPVQGWRYCEVQRLGPVLAAFVFLTVYGFATAWDEVRKSEKLWEIKNRVVSQLKLAWRPTFLVSVLLAAVFLTAFNTLPDRLMHLPSNWTEATWREHLEDVLSRPGVKEQCQFQIHTALAGLYEPVDAAQSKRHAAEAKKHWKEWKKSAQ